MAGEVESRGRRAPASLATRIGIASVALALLVTAAFAVLLLAITSLRSATADANRSKDLTAATLRLEKLVVDADNGLQGFVITGKERFLASWRRARSAMPASIEEVERLAVDQPLQARRARRLVTEIGDYVQDYSIPLVAIARRDPVAARASVATAEGKRRLDVIQAQFRRLLGTEDSRAAVREASAASQERRAIVAAAAALVGSALLISLFGFNLARGIARPVRRTAEAADEVATGNLAVRLPEDGSRELHTLARAFNAMAESIAQGKSELEAQNEKLRESERLRSELVSMISHEVRTPLASVLGYAQLLCRREFDRDTQRRYLEIIEAQGQRLSALVQELLDVRHLEEGRLRLEEKSVDLVAVVHEQADAFAGHSARHSIRADLPKGALTVVADAGRLAQVVGNLITNAIKYSPKGGAVEVSCRREGRAVRVSVRDHGIGIPAEHQARIFTKFFRGEALAYGISGAGLGLAISREIVEAHGGRIGFTSSIGDGSIFWFELPLAADTQPAGSHAA